MLLIHQIAIYVHIAGGFAALLLFWIPMFARKGSPIHKRIGRYFAMLMYMIGLSGLLMSSMDLLMPEALHPDRSVTGTRNTAMFLFSLSLLVLASTRHGWLTVNHRENRQPLRHPLQLLLQGALLACGAGLLGLGLMRSNPIFIAFGILEIALSLGMLHYTFKAQPFPKQWWTEHLGGLIAAGIGAYTAFFVFGAVSLMEPLFARLPWLQMLVWVGPGVIGGVAITIISRHYRRKFSPKPAAGKR
jgi:hypothetical protein